MIIVASRWGWRAPWRFRAVTMRRSASSGVRYSRGRRAALATRRGGTFPFTVLGLSPSFTREPLRLMEPWYPTFPFMGGYRWRIGQAARAAKREGRVVARGIAWNQAASR